MSQMVPEDNMTEEQYLEIAARRLCEIRKLDPDEKIGYSGAMDTWQYGPRWVTLVEEIRAHMQVQRACTHATLCKINPTYAEKYHFPVDQ